MKSEERHQLLTNDLGVVTTKTVGFFERHLGTIVTVACAVLLVSAIGFWWNRSTGSENAAAWTMLDNATNQDELGAVVDKFKGKPPARWAQLQIAEQRLQSAMPLMFSNRELALTDVKSAREKFESLLQDKAVPPQIRERALWGLALSLETSCDGDTSKPIKAYDLLLAEFPETIFKPVAENRLAELKKAEASEFYTWFSKENPKPPEVRPRDFNPHGINLPAPTDPNDEPDDDVTKSPEKPQAPVDDKTPATDKPEVQGEKSQDASKPADIPEGDKPAEPAKPVEGDKPAATESPKDGDKPNEKN